MIENWKPWLHATGPRTPDGKARAALNAYKGGHWLKLRELIKMVNAEIGGARDLVADCKQVGTKPSKFLEPPHR